MRELSPELALVDEDLARAARAALPAAPDVLDAIVRNRDSEPVRRLRAALVADDLPERRRARRPVLRLVAGGLAGLGAIAGAAIVARPDTSEQAAQIAAVRHRPVSVPAKRPARAARKTPVKEPAAPPKPRRVAPVRPVAVVVRRTPPAAPKPAHQAPTATATPTRHRPHVPAKPLHRTVGQAISKPATAAPAVRLPVLTWAADAEATHYRVGLFHDSDPPTLVCEVWTDDARLALASVSTPASRPLGPGEYRWVVYPVFGGDGSLGSGNTAGTQLAQGTFTI